jgi:hypothetical protein
MNPRTTSLVVTGLLLAAFAGCGTPDEGTPPVLATDPPGPPPDLPVPPTAATSEYCELAIFYRRELEKLRGLHDETHPDVALARGLAELAEARCSGTEVVQDSPSGQWVERDGQIVCDGYLTRFDDQDYCSADVPEDWKPFTFDGELYYVQPLDNVVPMQTFRGSPQETRKAP